MDHDLLCMTGFAFNRLMVVLNRSIPVAIAIYRYAHVFYYDIMYDKRQKKRLQLMLTAYTAGIARQFCFNFSTEQCSHSPDCRHPVSPRSSDPWSLVLPQQVPGLHGQRGDTLPGERCLQQFGARSIRSFSETQTRPS